jgi:anti-anti-sigma factor
VTVTIERPDAQIAHLIPSGLLDGDSLQAELIQAIGTAATDGATRFVLDMRSFSMLDSSGLGALVAAHSEVAGLPDARLVLTGITPTLRQTLSRAMLLQVLPVYDTVERAINALRR